MYTSTPDSTLILQVVRLSMEGHSWADIAAHVNWPADVVEEWPMRYPELWVEALDRLIRVAQQELVLRSLLQIQTVLPQTTDPRALASLVTALTRLTKPAKTATPTHAKTTAHPSSSRPEARPDVVEDVPAIQATLSPTEQHRYSALRQQFVAFDLFTSELQRREPTIYQKLTARNLLPQQPAEPSHPALQDSPTRSG